MQIKQYLFGQTMIILMVLTLHVHSGFAQSADLLPAKSREYYQSQVGLWYTVWWDSQERDPVYYEHHWVKETRVKPIKHGYYATDDPEKLEDDFRFFHRIGIDYLILDDTNGHYNDGGNIAAHIDACFVTARQLGNNAPKICFAGGRPLINGDVAGMQAELDIFADYAEKYPENTFFWKGKPLFVNFNIPKNYGYQDEQGRFTMRPAAGHLLEGFSWYKEYELDKIGMYGWVFDMQYETSEVHGITPGFSRSHNDLGTTLEPISRENGERYQREWLSAVKRKPEMIVISSWNDHAEETGIEAVELLEPIPGRGKEDPFFYEKVTEGYLALKTGFLENWHYRSESDPQVYQYHAGRLNRVSRLNAKEIVIVVPDDYFDWSGVPWN
ncbi:MAG: hypothetical protein FWD31_07940 [Planctomycetaceae bacterium]|nr:hypothetical protein [Planctomycetaceae bacterium]